MAACRSKHALRLSGLFSMCLVRWVGICGGEVERIYCSVTQDVSDEEFSCRLLMGRCSGVILVMMQRSINNI